MGPAGAGVQDLTAIGQKIVHAAASTTGPVNLGSNVAEELILQEWRSHARVQGHRRGQRRSVRPPRNGFRPRFLAMALRPAPNVEIKTTGGSRYKADIYVNLATHW